MLKDKVTLRVADGRSDSAGREREGREGKKAVPQVTKVFRVKDRGSICSGLGGHCIGGQGETCCRGVCAAWPFSVWVDLYLKLD